MPRTNQLRLIALAAAGLAMALSPAAGRAQGYGMSLAPGPATLQDQPIQVEAVPPPEVQIDEAVAFNRTERWLIPFFFQKEYGNRRHAARSRKNNRVAPASFKQAPEIGDILSAAQIADLTRLPGPLVRELPARRPDTQRYVAGPDVLLVQESTGKVLDKLGGAVR